MTTAEPPPRRQKRLRRWVIRCREDEAAQLVRCARRLGLPMATFAREAMLLYVQAVDAVDDQHRQSGKRLRRAAARRLHLEPRE